MEELKHYGPGGGEVAAVAGENRAQVFRGAGFVIGGDLDDEGHTARAIGLVGHLLVDDAWEFAGAFLDGTVQIFGGHVRFTGFQKQRAKAGVPVGITPTGFGGEGDLARQTGKNFATAAVGDGFQALNFGPLVMAGHGSLFFLGRDVFHGLAPGSDGGGHGRFLLLLHAVDEQLLRNGEQTVGR